LADPVNPRRRYDASGRQQQARRNRLSVLNAARRQLLEQGYASTTIGAIAAEAGVSVETVYKAFGNKAGLLKAVFDVAIVGDDEPVPMLERDFVRRNMAEPDPRKKLRMYGEFFAQNAVRAMPVQLLARDAAAGDPGAAAVWEQMLTERLTGMTAFARHLYDGGFLRDGITVDEARDILWTFTSTELYELLVVRREWPPTKFGQWMSEMLIAALLP
jgi:AcrR family transcriptional regulator